MNDYCTGSERGLEYHTGKRTDGAEFGCFQCGTLIAVTIVHTTARPKMCQCGRPYIGEAQADGRFVAWTPARKVQAKQ